MNVEPPKFPPAQSANNYSVSFWLATGFGIGQARFAPGTFGTIPGFFIAAFLLFLGPVFFPLALLALLLLSIATASQAQKYFSRPDPPQIVIDEYSAFAASLAAWPYFWLNATHSWPLLQDLISHPFAVPILIAHFLLFRIFDIFKPFPVNLAEKLPGGWGITADDWMAALYTALCASFLLWLIRFPSLP
ncbi:MAG: phosphatidylglycerophosphatase A [Verrucomicrobia bacterium]|nr:phosphatidylglycerophosphatase A [Verrucomicrobiota bacterium]